MKACRILDERVQTRARSIHRSRLLINVVDHGKVTNSEIPDTCTIPAKFPVSLLSSALFMPDVRDQQYVDLTIRANVRSKNQSELDQPRWRPRCSQIPESQSLVRHCAEAFIRASDLLCSEQPTHSLLQAGVPCIDTSLDSPCFCST